MASKISLFYLLFLMANLQPVISQQRGQILSGVMLENSAWGTFSPILRLNTAFEKGDYRKKATLEDLTQERRVKLAGKYADRHLDLVRRGDSQAVYSQPAFGRNH